MRLFATPIVTLGWRRITPKQRALEQSVEYVGGMKRGGRRQRGFIVKNK